MPGRNVDYMKVLDLVAAMLLFIGGINWGLVGLFKFNLIEYLFGSLGFITRLLYILVGVSALYDAVGLTFIQRRWGCAGFYGRAGRAET